MIFKYVGRLASRAYKNDVHDCNAWQAVMAQSAEMHVFLQIIVFIISKKYDIVNVPLVYFPGIVAGIRYKKEGLHEFTC